jgi:hypothetical protein
MESDEEDDDGDEGNGVGGYRSWGLEEEERGYAAGAPQVEPPCLTPESAAPMHATSDRLSAGALQVWASVERQRRRRRSENVLVPQAVGMPWGEDGLYHPVKGHLPVGIFVPHNGPGECCVRPAPVYALLILTPCPLLQSSRGPPSLWLSW